MAKYKVRLTVEKITEYDTCPCTYCLTKRSALGEFTLTTDSDEIPQIIAGLVKFKADGPYAGIRAEIS